MMNAIMKNLLFVKTQIFLDTEIRMNLGNGKYYPSQSDFEELEVPRPKELLDAAEWYWNRRHQKTI